MSFILDGEFYNSKKQERKLFFVLDHLHGAINILVFV